MTSPCRACVARRFATYGLGEGPATRVSLSLPEGTAEAIRVRVGKREFSAFIAEAVERELRGQILDEYLADYENRKVPLSERARQRAWQVFDEVFAEEARAASKPLMEAGLRGHKYAIYAAVAEAALRQRRPVVMLISDIDDMVRRCGDRVRLVAV